MINSRADSPHSTNSLMSRHDWKPACCQVSLDNLQIGSADGTCRYLESDLARTRFEFESIHRV